MFTAFHALLIHALDKDIARKNASGDTLVKTSTIYHLSAFDDDKALTVGDLHTVDLKNFVFQGKEPPDWTFLSSDGYTSLANALSHVEFVGVYTSPTKLFSKIKENSIVVLTYDNAPFMSLIKPGSL